MLEGLPNNISGKFNLVCVGPHYPDTKPRRSFLNFRKRWCTPQRTDAVKVLRRKQKKVSYLMSLLADLSTAELMLLAYQI